MLESVFLKIKYLIKFRKKNKNLCIIHFLFEKKCLIMILVKIF